MATIDLGRIKFKWQGAWSSSTAYVVDDVVESGGNTYVCILASTNNVPPNATYWELMAQKGTDTSVATTQGDIIYHNGSSLARLGAGTSGQYLETKGTGQNPVWSTVSTGAYSIAEYLISDNLGSTSTSSNNTSVRIGSNEITLTPSASTDLIQVIVSIPTVAPSGAYSGIGVKYSTTSGSYSTATGTNNLISNGEHPFSTGTSDNRYRMQHINAIRTASDFGLTAGTTYYLSVHGNSHSGSGSFSFGIGTGNDHKSKNFQIIRYTA